jgi:hypothetical protein
MLFRAHTQSNKLGIAANMAVAKAFPDRGGGGYLRALHTDFVRVVDLGPAISPGARCVLGTGCMFMPIQRSIGLAVAW